MCLGVQFFSSDEIRRFRMQCLTIELSGDCIHPFGGVAPEAENFSLQTCLTWECHYGSVALVIYRAAD